MKKYKEKEVVNNVLLKIEKGKITSFIGQNGAGKSTVLSIIVRIMEKDSGEILIECKKKAYNFYFYKGIKVKCAFIISTKNGRLKK